VSKVGNCLGFDLHGDLEAEEGVSIVVKQPPDTCKKRRVTFQKNDPHTLLDTGAAMLNRLFYVRRYKQAKQLKMGPKRNFFEDRA
jgi:hypothetical protein